MMLHLKIYWISVYPLSSLFLHGNKGSADEQKNKEHFSAPVVDLQSSKFIVIKLYFQKINQLVWLYLLKILQVQKLVIAPGLICWLESSCLGQRYIHRKKARVDNKNTDQSLAIALCITLLSSSQCFSLILDNVHSATDVLLLSLMAIKQKILHNAEETSWLFWLCVSMSI